MNKKIFILFYLFLGLFVYSDGFEILNSFYGYDYYGNEIEIQAVKYDIYYGFKIGQIFFLTDKSKYDLTIHQDKKNYIWFCFTENIRGEILKVTNPVWCLAVYDLQIGTVTFIFNLQLFSYGIKHYSIEFEQRFLKR